MGAVCVSVCMVVPLSDYLCRDGVSFHEEALPTYSALVYSDSGDLVLLDRCRLVGLVVANNCCFFISLDLDVFFVHLYAGRFSSLVCRMSLKLIYWYWLGFGTVFCVLADHAITLILVQFIEGVAVFG